MLQLTGIIVDPSVNIAGSFKALSRGRDGRYYLVEWRRSTKITKPGVDPIHFVTLKPPFEKYPQSRYYECALHLNLYRAILEKSYNLLVDRLILVQFNLEAKDYSYLLTEVEHMPEVDQLLQRLSLPPLISIKKFSLRGEEESEETSEEGSEDELVDENKGKFVQRNYERSNERNTFDIDESEETSEEVSEDEESQRQITLENESVGDFERVFEKSKSKGSTRKSTYEETSEEVSEDEDSQNHLTSEEESVDNYERDIKKNKNKGSFRSVEVSEAGENQKQLTSEEESGYGYERDSKKSKNKDLLKLESSSKGQPRKVEKMAPRKVYACDQREVNFGVLKEDYQGFRKAELIKNSSNVINSSGIERVIRRNVNSEVKKESENEATGKSIKNFEFNEKNKKVNSKIRSKVNSVSANHERKIWRATGRKIYVGEESVEPSEGEYEREGKKGVLNENRVDLVTRKIRSVVSCEKDVKDESEEEVNSAKDFVEEYESIRKIEKLKKNNLKDNVKMVISNKYEDDDESKSVIRVNQENWARDLEEKNRNFRKKQKLKTVYIGVSSKDEVIGSQGSVKIQSDKESINNSTKSQQLFLREKKKAIEPEEVHENVKMKRFIKKEREGIIKPERKEDNICKKNKDKYERQREKVNFERVHKVINLNIQRKIVSSKKIYSKGKRDKRGNISNNAPTKKPLLQLNESTDFVKGHIEDRGRINNLRKNAYITCEEDDSGVEKKNTDEPNYDSDVNSYTEVRSRKSEEEKGMKNKGKIVHREGKAWMNSFFEGNNRREEGTDEPDEDLYKKGKVCANESDDVKKERYKGSDGERDDIFSYANEESKIEKTVKNREKLVVGSRFYGSNANKESTDESNEEQENLIHNKKGQLLYQESEDKSEDNSGGMPSSESEKEGMNSVHASGQEYVRARVQQIAKTKVEPKDKVNLHELDFKFGELTITDTVNNKFVIKENAETCNSYTNEDFIVEENKFSMGRFDNKENEDVIVGKKEFLSKGNLLLSSSARDALSSPCSPKNCTDNKCNTQVIDIDNEDEDSEEPLESEDCAEDSEFEEEDDEEDESEDSDDDEGSERTEEDDDVG
jgi:hypothetical protein